MPTVLAEFVNRSRRSLVFGVLFALLVGCQPTTLVHSAKSDRIQLPLTAFQQTTDYTCGPACLVSLEKFYGISVDEMQVARESHCNKDFGTTPQDMASWLSQHGFDVRWGENGSLDMLRDNLARGVPTLVEWIDWGGHWVIVVGYDTKGTPTLDDDDLILADPSDCTDGVVDGVTTFNAERFDSMWFDAFLFGKPMHKIFITATPRRHAAAATSRSR